MKITTKTGFVCNVDKDTLNDMRLLEMIAEMQDDALVLPRFLNAFLGVEQKEALYTHCDTKGRADIEKVQEEIADIMEQMGEDGKK